MVYFSQQTTQNRFSVRQFSLVKWTAVIFLASCQIGCSINADRYNRLGKEAFDDGKMTEAINQFQTALSADPNSSDAYYNLAASYYTLGKRTNNPQALKQAKLAMPALQRRREHARKPTFPQAPRHHSQHLQR